MWNVCMEIVAETEERVNALSYIMIEIDCRSDRYGYRAGGDR